MAEQNPKAKSILLYKAEIQDRKHEIITNEEEYTKVLNIIDQVLAQVEEQLKKQPEGNYSNFDFIEGGKIFLRNTRNNVNVPCSLSRTTRRIKLEHEISRHITYIQN